jgi:hypothetical protein
MTRQDLDSLVWLHDQGVRSPILMRELNVMADKALASMEPHGSAKATGIAQAVLPVGSVTSEAVAEALLSLGIQHARSVGDSGGDGPRPEDCVFRFGLNDRAYIASVALALDLSGDAVNALRDIPIVSYDLVLAAGRDGGPSTLYLNGESELLDRLLETGRVILEPVKALGIAADWHANHVAPTARATTGRDGAITLRTCWGCSVRQSMDRATLVDQIDWAIETTSAFWRSALRTLIGA